MVDWDRVEELRSNDESWSDIAADPKVGFHPDASAGDPGRALRALYHLEKRRSSRQGPPPVSKKRPARDLEQRWSLVRIGYLAVPIVGVWFLLAYVAPSPVGLLLPAIPYLALALAAVAFFLLYALWRSRDRRWSAVFRGTVIGGVVLGLVVAGLIGLVGALVFGCPYLPPAASVGSTSNATGWVGPGSLPSWTSGGQPVVYFYGATWCPYCSASSWSIWKALSMYGTWSGVAPSYSYGSPEPYPHTPEMVLATGSLKSSAVAFEVNEYNGGVDGTPPTTSTCYQLAYVTAFSGGTIPFLEVGGKYVHARTTIINPANLTSWEDTGAQTVKDDVKNETGEPWDVVRSQVFWIMALIAKCDGQSSVTSWSVASSWSAGNKAGVNADLAQI